jgi:hypothetical protein
MHFMFDIETLGIESNSIVLSAAIIYFSEEEVEFDMDTLRERALFVKFSISEQVEKYQRTHTKDTVLWWKGQPEYARKKSLPETSKDLEAETGLELLRKYVDTHTEKGVETTIWARGSLDQMAIDSLARAVGVKPIAPYWVWRDVRTAIDVIHGTSRGYRNIPGLPYDSVLKHDPVDDCAYDIIMLCKG